MHAVTLGAPIVVAGVPGGVSVFRRFAAAVVVAGTRSGIGSRIDVARAQTGPGLVGGSGKGPVGSGGGDGEEGGGGELEDHHGEKVWGEKVCVVGIGLCVARQGVVIRCTCKSVTFGFCDQPV